MEYDKSYTQYQLQKRSILRKIFREFYLNSISKLLTGKIIDFGCGTGELLKKMPAGSVGVEVNPYTVKYCRQQGLDVRPYNPDEDNYNLLDFEKDTFDSLLLYHVLEHLESPDFALTSLLQAADRLGIKRVVVVVPCKKGFSFDPTHQYFVDSLFFKQFKLNEYSGYTINLQKYFPFNLKFLGDLFIYQELRTVYNKPQCCINNMAYCI